MQFILFRVSLYTTRKRFSLERRLTIQVWSIFIKIVQNTKGFVFHKILLLITLRVTKSSFFLMKTIESKRVNHSNKSIILQMMIRKGTKEALKLFNPFHLRKQSWKNRFYSCSELIGLKNKLKKSTKRIFSNLRLLRVVSKNKKRQ